MISRKLLRWLVRFAVLLTLLSLSLFVTDLWYDFLPSVIQTRLPLHPPEPVLVDIQIKRCGLFGSCEISGGNWIKIPKDLYLGESWTSKAYVYTKAINENELPSRQDVILKIAHGNFDLDSVETTIPQQIYLDLLPHVDSPKLLEDRYYAHKLALQQGWSLRDKELGLWIKKGKHVPNSAVTAVKVLFGDDARYPLPGWSICSQGLNIGQPKLQPRLAYKVGRHEVPEKRPQLKFSKAGKLKVLQLADLHMSTGSGVCDHVVPAPLPNTECRADNLTAQFVAETIHYEQPDYVIFTGDQIFGSASPDPETALLKALAPVIEKKIPFSVIWGNHDDQGPLQNKELMDIVIDLPYAIAAHGPEEVTGDGNYLVTASPSNSDYPALSMIFLDSHSKMKVKGGGAYDFIHQDQLDFVKHEMDEIRAKLKGYPHLPLSLAFFHIPVPEFRKGFDQTSDDRLIRIGQQRENVIGPTFDPGVVRTLRELGISVISVGHDHCNDFCQLTPPDEGDASFEDIWLCYGGGAGFGGYGGYPDASGDYKRRIRVFDIDMNLPYIDTWHRVQHLKPIQNRVRLVDSGVARYGLGTLRQSELEEKKEKELDKEYEKQEALASQESAKQKSSSTGEAEAQEGDVGGNAERTSNDETNVEGTNVERTNAGESG